MAWGQKGIQSLMRELDRVWHVPATLSPAFSLCHLAGLSGRGLWPLEPWPRGVPGAPRASGPLLRVRSSEGHPPVGVSLLTSPLEALAVHLRLEEN